MLNYGSKFRALRDKNNKYSNSFVVRKKISEPLHMNDQDLHVVNSHKHLRVITSDNGQWNDHIDYII
jgi:hypothetical protein